MSSYQWINDTEAYKRKRKSKNVLQSEKVEKHPLLSHSSTVSSKDKLILKTEPVDPLTRMAADLDYNPELFNKNDNFEPWSSKKVGILNKFTTQEKMSITTSFFAADHEVRGVSEKVLHRLEQLDLDCGSKQFFGGLSQEEYINKINQLDQQLTQAWQADLRVNALKISIQCCKLLGDSSVVSFYPSKFVIITDILDKFGDMVYCRLQGKQNDTHAATEIAKETCKNWFFKVGSIRELLPRVCLELAILKSYAFISPNPDYGRILSRLLNSMWGIGDPVVAIYMRCYLCRKAMELVPNSRELYMQSFQDLLLLHDQAFDNFRHNPHYNEAKVAMETYMSILSPAVDWILQCLVHRGEHLTYVVQLVSSLPPFWKSVLISSVLSTFPPTFIGEECLHILEMILSLETNLGTILRNLGLCLIVVDHQQKAKEIWNQVWPVIRQIQDRNQYLSCCQVWIEFAVKHFGSDVISSVLDDVMEHVRYRDVDQFQGKLASIIEKLLTYSDDITQLLHMDKFIKMITMLNVDTVKSVILVYNTKHPEPLGNNIVINTLLHLATIVHDSVDALTPLDEIKQMGNLINGYILRVNFGRDFEKQLQFYDEARGAFSNIDAVLVQLIQCVCTLGMNVRSLVDGHHTKRTRAFLSACIAYAFITIPSLENNFTQLQLYLLTSQVAYSNHCVSQGEACLKAIVHVLSTNSVADFDCGEAMFLEYINNLLSTCLAVPDHPKEPMLYLIKALMSIEWTIPNVYISTLSLLGAYAQEKYAYHFNGVDANDGLYGGDEKFLTEIDSTASSILNEILSLTKTLLEQNQLKKQGKLSLDLFTQITSWGDLNQMGTLAINLWNFSRKNIEHKLAIRSLETIRRKASYRKEFQQLASKMTLD